MNIAHQQTVLVGNANIIPSGEDTSFLHALPTLQELPNTCGKLAGEDLAFARIHILLPVLIAPKPGFSYTQCG
ncbi:MAG: hypothetical protein GDA43_02160 [Hormoscilla sp. SP5CHS1]|nr:hypothetical protein [Hormoscilla sp. SP5CHS1]